VLPRTAGENPHPDGTDDLVPAGLGIAGVLRRGLVAHARREEVAVLRGPESRRRPARHSGRCNISFRSRKSLHLRDFGTLCKELGVTQSTDGLGSSADNALAESLPATLKSRVFQHRSSWPDAPTCLPLAGPLQHRTTALSLRHSGPSTTRGQGPSDSLANSRPVGQSEATRAQSSSAAAASVQASPLSTTSVAPASR
jgi:hypothetical protein